MSSSLFTIGIVGAGTMGAGIAQIAAANGHTVYLYDSFTPQLENAKQSLEKILNRQVEKQRMTREDVDGILERIHFEETTTKFGDCGFVIEAVLENLDVKKDVFTRLEAIVPKTCILATNTSSLSIASISSSLKRPARCIGVHFFNPAPLMKLVEIIPGIPTSDETLARAHELIKGWGKTTVTAKDTPGFIVNRVARPFYGEALRILEEGIADVPTIDWAMKTIGGFRMGPFELMDLIGHDVNYEVTSSVFEAFYYDPRFKPSFAQKRLVEAGWLGKKTGKGFYDYSDQASNPQPVEDTDLGERIVNRIVAMLINEAYDAVFMGIGTEEDVDLAMKNGVNYPKGLMQWSKEIGEAVVYSRLSQLQDEYGEDRYRPNALLRRRVNG